MSYFRINITVRPTVEIQEAAIKLSKQIADETGAYFILDNINYFPHITIYSPELPEKNKAQIFESIEEIASNSLPFEATIDKLSTHKGYIDYQIKKDENWLKLHEQIINTINPLRENHIRAKFSNPEELAKLTEEQQNYILKFGYPEVFNTYRPHVTISRIRDENKAEALISKLEFNPTTFLANNLTVFTMGEHGTCTSIIKEYNFK